MPTEHPATAASPYDAVPHQDPHAHAQPLADLEPDAHQDAHSHEAAMQAELPPEHEAADDLDAAPVYEHRAHTTAEQLDHIVVLIRAAEHAFQQLNDAVRATNISFGQLAALREHVNRDAGPRVAYNPIGIHRQRKRRGSPGW